MVAHTKPFENAAAILAARSSGNPIANNIAYFRAHHPVDPCDCEYSELAYHIEDTGLLNLSLPFILRGLAETEGATWHYFHGLMKAQVELRPRLTGMESTSRLIGELLKVCVHEYDLINQEALHDAQASSLAMLETAAYLLVHYSPHEGKQWLDAIYQD
ncbi:MAG: hypothetical protein LW710_13805 [Burkholderiales bacterium]|jgi:hypothetical protein|uniref:hypothetical protein n=1 Tax=Limnobacter sp. TaxID=2003368 RepID=UPI0039428D31|nr:hypothetical protein [Burkholderiales bacterium]